MLDLGNFIFIKFNFILEKNGEINADLFVTLAQENDIELSMKDV
jgi:hypothetical protein